jgi:TRAP-type C4-dicarboxylate transport system substrate-binding protein
MDVVFNAWADKIKADSGGKLTIRIYPGATLSAAPGTYKAVTDGVMDIGASYRYGAPGSEFVTSFSTMFAGVPNVRIGTQLLDDVRAQFADAFNKEWKDNKMLWIVAEGGANIVTVNKQITQMSDIKGLQLRVPTAQTAEVIKSLGGTSVTMPLTDLTTALQKNTVNGCTMQFYSLKVYKIADLTKYVIQMPLYAPPDYGVTMNLNTYNSLSPDLQKVINDSLPWAKEQTLKAYEQADAEGKAYGEAQGLKFTTLAPEEQARWFLVIDTVLKNQAAALDAKGYPDTAALNFIKADLAKLTSK